MVLFTKKKRNCERITWSEFIVDLLYNIQGKKQTGLNYSKYSLLDSTGFLASQLIAIFAVTICGLVWIHCLCIFVYWSISTSYSFLYSSLLRYVYCLDLMEGSIAVVRLFTGFIADLYHCVLSLVIAIYSCYCWVDLNHGEVALFLT